jgi:hypothetical protein
MEAHGKTLNIQQLTSVSCVDPVAMDQRKGFEHVPCGDRRKEGGITNGCGKSMSNLTIFKSPVPAGMRIFEHGVVVEGADKRFHNARSFVKRTKRRIYLQRVPDNKRKPDAIRVIGKSKGWFFEKNKCIGYVPADIARKLVLAKMENKVKARLQLVSIGQRKSIEIRFDIFGPADDFEKYAP